MSNAFLVVERSGADAAWTPASGLLATAHDARRTLDFTLTWWRPRHAHAGPRLSPTSGEGSTQSRVRGARRMCVVL
ncbi:DUF5954 family protein [Streptomyces sp. NPDC056269]|uniref:DUF5954 family protein n=1 Tax=Streptomyces sp. NPDC056269 TaxID=3345768 RepID=UPI0035DC2426